LSEPAYRVVFRSPARRAVAERLPEPVAAAVLEFCYGPLTDNPHRVGKALSGPLTGLHGARRSTYRIVHLIDKRAPRRRSPRRRAPRRHLSETMTPQP